MKTTCCLATIPVDRLGGVLLRLLTNCYGKTTLPNLHVRCLRCVERGILYPSEKAFHHYHHLHVTHDSKFSRQYELQYTSVSSTHCLQTVWQGTLQCMSPGFGSTSAYRIQVLFCRSFLLLSRNACNPPPRY